MESWAIYNTSTGFIICWGRNLDRVADQQDIDNGGTSSMLYLINNMLSSNPDLSVWYGDNNAAVNIDQDCMQIDNGAICIMELPELQSVIKKYANNDILTYHHHIKQIEDLLNDIGSGIPSAATILSDIALKIIELESSKSNIDIEINNLATQREAVNYLNNKQWRFALPSPLNWEDM